MQLRLRMHELMLIQQNLRIQQPNPVAIIASSTRRATSRAHVSLANASILFHRTHLLGTDKVVSQSSRFFLRQHDNLDGFLREALEGVRRLTCTSSVTRPTVDVRARIRVHAMQNIFVHQSLVSRASTYLEHRLDDEFTTTVRA